MAPTLVSSTPYIVIPEKYGTYFLSTSVLDLFSLGTQYLYKLSGIRER